MPEVGGDDVTVVEDPSVSRVFYRSVESGHTHRYRLRPDDGADLHVMVMVPEPTASPPTATVTGRGIDADITGRADEPTFEPFAPDVQYEVGRLDREVSGDTGAVTVNVSGEGPYGLVVGRGERFTATEWLTTGVAVPRTRFWAGRWWLLLPGAAAATGAAVWLRRRDVTGLRGWTAGAAGALAVGSAASTAATLGWAATVVSTGPAAAVPAGIAALQGAVGAGLLRAARDPSADRGWRLRVGGLGVGAAVVWAGAVVGPMFAVFAAMPGLENLRGSNEG